MFSMAFSIGTLPQIGFTPAYFQCSKPWHFRMECPDTISQEANKELTAANTGNEPSPSVALKSQD